MLFAFIIAVHCIQCHLPILTFSLPNWLWSSHVNRWLYHCWQENILFPFAGKQFRTHLYKPDMVSEVEKRLHTLPGRKAQGLEPHTDQVDLLLSPVLPCHIERVRRGNATSHISKKLLFAFPVLRHHSLSWPIDLSEHFLTLGWPSTIVVRTSHPCMSRFARSLNKEIPAPCLCLPLQTWHCHHLFSLFDQFTFSLLPLGRIFLWTKEIFIIVTMTFT